MSIVSCRKGCGACCIAPSLSSPIPGMPGGKPAGVRCVQLTEDNLCRVFERPERPRVCASYRATEEYCGSSREEALALLAELEARTGNRECGMERQCGMANADCGIDNAYSTLRFD